MKSVLILSPSYHPNTGGLETHLTDLVTEASKKYKLYVLTYQPIVTNATGKPYETLPNVEIRRISWFYRGLFLKLTKYPVLEFIYLSPGLLIYGLYLLRRRKFDLIHAQGLVAGAVGVILSKLFHKKLIISTHALYHFPNGSPYSKFSKWVLDSADTVLTLSKQSKKEIESLGINRDKVKVFTYWVNGKVFYSISKSTAQKRLKLGNHFYVLFVGRLVNEKGVNELLESVSLTDDNIHYLIAGDGPLGSKVKEYSKKYKKMTFLGRIENKDMSNLYNASSLVIVPSIHDEGFGRVILESLMCGTPVIAANRGGIPEAMNESVGSLIEISPQNIALEIEKYFIDTDLLSKKSINAIQFAVKKYGHQNSQNILTNYE